MRTLSQKLWKLHLLWYVTWNIHLNGTYGNKKNLLWFCLWVITAQSVGSLEKIYPKSQWSVYRLPNGMHYRALVFRQKTNVWLNKYVVLFETYLCMCSFWALFVIHPRCIVFPIKQQPINRILPKVLFCLCRLLVFLTIIASKWYAKHKLPKIWQILGVAKPLWSYYLKNNGKKVNNSSIIKKIIKKAEPAMFFYSTKQPCMISKGSNENVGGDAFYS